MDKLPVRKSAALDIRQCPHCNQLISNAAINFDRHERLCLALLEAEIAEGEHEAGFCLDCDASPCECTSCPHCGHASNKDMQCDDTWCDHCGHHYPGA